MKIMANPWYYEMHDIGLNYRLTDVQCALHKSVKKITKLCKKRRSLVAQYDANFQNDLCLISPIKNYEVVRLLGIYMSLRSIFKGLAKMLCCYGGAKKKYRSQVHYLPVHLQPFYRRQNSVSSLPGAEAYYDAVSPLHKHDPNDVDYGL